MVICAIIGCSNRSDRDNVHFYRLPAIVKHQGEQMLSITTKQRCAWLKAISRADLTGDKLSNVFVCEEHFVHGKNASNIQVVLFMCNNYILQASQHITCIRLM